MTREDAEFLTKLFGFPGVVVVFLVLLFMPVKGLEAGLVPSKQRTKES